MKSLKYLIKGTGITPLSIALIYCVLGLLWFYITNTFLSKQSLMVEAYKDYSFVLITSAIIFILIRKKSSVLHRIQEQHRAIIRLVIKNREADSEHIAYKIQNEFNQELAAIKIQLTALKTRYAKNPEEFDKYLVTETDAISEGINALIKKFRNFTDEIRPEVLEDLDLKDSIEWLASDHCKRTGVKTSFVAKIEEFKLDKKKSVNIFRALQEAIAFPHASEGIEIKAASTKRAFIFAVSFVNNRKEFFPIAQNETALLSLRERIAMVEGELTEIKSEKGLFRISFYVPKTDIL